MQFTYMELSFRYPTMDIGFGDQVLVGLCSIFAPDYGFGCIIFLKLVSAVVSMKSWFDLLSWSRISHIFSQ
jgi:hypothetical protein